MKRGLGRPEPWNAHSLAEIELDLCMKSGPGRPGFGMGTFKRRCTRICASKGPGPAGALKWAFDKRQCNQSFV